MKNNDLVSVIIPVYNAEKYVAEAIESVKSQTYKNWEIILIDDKSSDKSIEVIKKYSDKKIHLIENKKNLGPALSRNKGTKAAKGRFIAFLDADDLWRPEKLEKQLNFMRKKNAKFSFTSYNYADSFAIPNGKIAHAPKTISYNQALKNTIISTPTVILDIKRLSKNQIYMPNIPSEDTATWWSILRTGEIAFGLDSPLSIYRRPLRSLSSNKATALKRTWNLYRKLEDLSILSSILCFCCYAINATRRRL